MGIGFVKQVGFKLGVKREGVMDASYGCCCCFSVNVLPNRKPVKSDNVVERLFLSC